VELAAAVAIGYGSWEFVNSLVEGFIIAPIETRFRGESAGAMTFEVSDATFYYSPFVNYGLSFLIYATLVALVAKRLRSRLWDLRELRECPHCLEEMPAPATVCGSCGRDAPPQPTTRAAVETD
jgi:large-conductance mechanosensitive channel